MPICNGYQYTSRIHNFYDEHAFNTGLKPFFLGMHERKQSRSTSTDTGGVKGDVQSCRIIIDYWLIIWISTL